jgi:hypothetical protein
LIPGNTLHLLWVFDHRQEDGGRVVCRGQVRGGRMERTAEAAVRTAEGAVRWEEQALEEI